MIKLRSKTGRRANAPVDAEPKVSQICVRSVAVGQVKTSNKLKAVIVAAFSTAKAVEMASSYIG